MFVSGVLCVCAHEQGGVHAQTMHEHSESREVCQGFCSITLSLIPLKQDYVLDLGADCLARLASKLTGPTCLCPIHLGL